MLLVMSLWLISFLFVLVLHKIECAKGELIVLSHREVLLRIVAGPRGFLASDDVERVIVVVLLISFG